MNEIRVMLAFASIIFAIDYFFVAILSDIRKIPTWLTIGALFNIPLMIWAAWPR